MPWRTIRHEDDKPLLKWQLETMVRGFFDRELFLDYIRYFVIFETDSGKLLQQPEMNNPTLILVTDRNDLDSQLYAILLEKLDIIHGMFAPAPRGKGLDYSGFEKGPFKLLVPTANYVLSLEDGKKRFLDTVLAMNKAFSLRATLD